MKELVEKAIDQLVDLVVLLPAGGLLLAAIVWLWLDTDSVPTSVHSLFGDTSTVFAAMLIAASALGLLMFGWAAEGADAYLASIGEKGHWAVRLLHWMPVSLALKSPQSQIALRSIANDYTEVEPPAPRRDEPSPDSLPDRRDFPPGPWRSIARFTALVPDLRPRTYGLRLRRELDPTPSAAWDTRSYSSAPYVNGPSESPSQRASVSQAWSPSERPFYVWSITIELKNLHLRVVLTLSVALALAVTAMQVLLRIGIERLGFIDLPSASQTSLIAIGIASFLLSIGLRFLAGKLWREELELALLLYERITHDAGHLNVEDR